jgi:glucose/arabinose dehydrogenase
MHPFIINAEGSMYVDVATATNSCQLKNRTLKSPGVDPCTELETRGGIWLYDANKTNQSFSTAQRFATGIRNAEGFATDASGRLFATQHGRDQLHANWPDLYKPDQEATLPAEELLLLKAKGDYGWPECYYDAFAQNWSWRRNSAATAAKGSGYARTRLLRLRHFPPIGLLMPWCVTTRNNFRRATVTACS